MNALPSRSESAEPGPCPRDAELLRFDQGALPEDEAERLSQHIANCQRCGTLLSEQPREELHLMAQDLAPATSLLAEGEYQEARQALLDKPETISAKQLETAETSLSSIGRRGEGHVPPDVGSYHLRYELGRGAMGVVYRARHVNLKRDAALKILHPSLTADQEIVQRFYGEMEAIGQLRDPHIVQAYDAGQSNGVYFLAMEYVDGADAGRLCAQLGQLSVPDACEILRQAALGLETARRRSMVHRDLKPSNLMVGRTGQVKILDLGLASFRPDDLEHQRDDGAVGTVDYIAPELWSGSPPVDIRADIYSLGCTLYKLLAGHPPFYKAPDDGVSKMQAHLYQPVPPLREIRREVPRELESLVARMLAKRPDDRLPDPQAVADALEPLCEESDLAALVERCVPPLSDVTGRMPSTGPPALPRRRGDADAAVGRARCWPWPARHCLRCWRRSWYAGRMTERCSSPSTTPACTSRSGRGPSRPKTLVSRSAFVWIGASIRSRSPRTVSRFVVRRSRSYLEGKRS